jgi:hypothetical protein
MKQHPKPPASGGTGGRSGTGQARPHHGLDDADAPESEHAAVDRDKGALRSGSSYQSGGTQQDRAQVEAERKQREGGAGVASSPQGGADPAPGAAAVRGRH